MNNQSLSPNSTNKNINIYFRTSIEGNQDIEHGNTFNCNICQNKTITHKICKNCKQIFCSVCVNKRMENNNFCKKCQQKMTSNHINNNLNNKLEYFCINCDKYFIFLNEEKIIHYNHLIIQNLETYDKRYIFNFINKVKKKINELLIKLKEKENQIKQLNLKKREFLDTKITNINQLYFSSSKILFNKNFNYNKDKNKQNKNSRYNTNNESSVLEKKKFNELSKSYKNMEKYSNTKYSLTKIIGLLEDLQKKDEEIKEIESRYPIKLLRGEKIISVIFTTINNEFFYSIICKNTDIFVNIELEFYKKYPVYREFQNDFMVNNKIVQKYKTLDENNIYNSSIIFLNKIIDSNKE